MSWENRYKAYFELCKEASLDEEIFKNFKRHPDCTGMLEHVSYELGLEYIKVIKKYFPDLLNRIDRFITNDLVGNPYTYIYDGLEFSPSNLRYIKVLGDLINLCGTLNGLNIIEVGGGYGGQCKIIHDLLTPGSYTIIDHPDVLKLTDKYLSYFDIKRSNKTKFDLFISNYAFTEIDYNYQQEYKIKYIYNSKKGYMTCNWFGIRPDNGMKKEEIKELKTQGQFIPEEPLTGTNNCIYIWE
jgi:hypothetical protein